MISPEELRKLAARYENEFDSPIRENTVQKLRKAADEIERLHDEIAIARERLGPAGWKLLEELIELRKQCRPSKI